LPATSLPGAAWSAAASCRPPPVGVVPLTGISMAGLEVTCVATELHSFATGTPSRGVVPHCYMLSVVSCDCASADSRATADEPLRTGVVALGQCGGIEWPRGQSGRCIGETDGRTDPGVRTRDRAQISHHGGRDGGRGFERPRTDPPALGEGGEYSRGRPIAG